MAIRFNKKIRLMDDTNSPAFDLMIGAKAAMAVPPQIAVPATKRIR